MQLGFDGWGEDFNQFVEWRAADIYRIAWCELVRHPLQAPKEAIMPISDGKGAKRFFNIYEWPISYDSYGITINEFSSCFGRTYK